MLAKTEYFFEYKSNILCFLLEFTCINRIFSILENMLYNNEY